MKTNIFGYSVDGFPHECWRDGEKAYNSISADNDAVITSPISDLPFL
jgi:hypothetical protein